MTSKTKKSPGKAKKPYFTMKKDTPQKNMRDRDNKASPWLEDYMDMFSLTYKPITEAFIDRFSQEIIDWAKSDEGLTVIGFCRKKGLSDETYYRWVRKYPKIAAAHAFAKQQFIDKREVGGLTRKFDPNFAFNSLAKYDDSWKEFLQWRANLKRDEQAPTKTVIEINDLRTKIKE